ncbi:MAG: restriction endonuclease [Isosphaeraceae bacterium]|nr:restriction endonuclease [Isosphaeraceae bacterium]
MPAYSRQTIARYLKKADAAGTNDEKGDLFENLVEYLFSKVPGVPQVRRNVTSVFRSEELDLVVSNDKHPNGLVSLNTWIPVECKTTRGPIGSHELQVFIAKIERRSLDFGISIAWRGITGDAQLLTGAHDHASTALMKGIRIIVITRTDIEKLSSTEDLVGLIRTRLCDLFIKRSPLVLD